MIMRQPYRCNFTCHENDDIFYLNFLRGLILSRGVKQFPIMISIALKWVEDLNILNKDVVEDTLCENMLTLHVYT